MKGQHAEGNPDGVGTKLSGAGSRRTRLILACASNGRRENMPGKQILIVDDDKDLVEALKTILESAGYQITTASNGNEGWEKVQKSRPDLAIVDVVMDTIADGVRLTQRFRSDEKLKDMRILMLTGIREKTGFNLRPDSAEGFLYLPVDKFLEKPVDPSVLLNAVAELL
jgi:CheY-like chemotaxis protein